MKMLIIADDFTGALDTGIQFSKRGITVRVSMIGNYDLEQSCDDVEVLVVNTESRHIPAGDAYKAVYEITKKAVSMGVEYIYKKTDSTLRGNIGSELSAVMDAANAKTMMFVPAYPDLNRTTVNGTQYVEGVPLHNTAFANDILNPMKKSYIPDIISQQSSIDVKLINSLAQLSNINDANKQIYLFDSKTSNDIDTIGEFLQQKGMLRICAGCAGFADILSRRILFKTDKTAVTPQFGKKALIVSGSLHEKSMKQLQYGIQRGYPIVTLNIRQKLDTDYWHSEDGDTFIKTIKDYYQDNDLFIVRTTANEQARNETDEIAKRFGLVKTHNISSLIAKNTGILVKKVLIEADIPVLVVFGGDTALGIMEALGCNSVIPKGELEIGVAVSQISFDKKQCLMITKAGGFGSIEILGGIEQHLKGEKL